MRMNISGRGRKPFDIKLKDGDREDLALELSRALDEALSARSATDTEVEYWHALYEQARTRSATSGPWQDAADLTSYLGMQYVDVLRSQVVGAIFTDNVWIVEGYGEAAKNAPFVEEFHQWQQELEGFQAVFARGVHLALIEPRPAIEVYMETYRRPVRKTIWAATQLGPDGRMLVGDDLKPLLQQNEDGTYVEALDENTPAAQVEIDSYEVVARGPRERIIAWRDFLLLPGHASDKSEVWGYAKRFYRSLDDLQDRAKQGLYDKKAVEELGSDHERASVTTLAGESVGVAQTDGTEKVEKELWELTILKNLDGTGLRWYVVTLHKDKHVILRLQYDDIGRPRYFPLTAFPRPNLLEGYSYIGHKLITVIEEHTAWRNMTADDAAMQLQLPVIRKQGALWDPEDQPLGPKAVIDVRDPNEITFLQRQPNSEVGIERIRDCERAGERLSGITDAVAGVRPTESRTWSETEFIAQQSQGRSSEVVKNLQETLEDIGQVRHLLWKRALEDIGREGIEAPPAVADTLRLRTTPMPSLMPGPPTGALMGLEQRAPGIVTTTAPEPIRFTLNMMQGTFRFKPKGSVETADKNRQRYDWNQLWQALSAFAQVNPMIQMLLQTPQAAKALLEQTLRLYNVQDKQPFLGSEAMEAAQQQWAAIQQQTMAGAQPKANYLPPGEGGGGPPAGGRPPAAPMMGGGQ